MLCSAGKTNGTYTQYIKMRKLIYVVQKKRKINNMHPYFWEKKTNNSPLPHLFWVFP
jgi:hypothetical protein